MIEVTGIDETKKKVQDVISDSGSTIPIAVEVEGNGIDPINNEIRAAPVKSRTGYAKVQDDERLVDIVSRGMPKVQPIKVHASPDWTLVNHQTDHRYYDHRTGLYRTRPDIVHGGVVHGCTVRDVKPAKSRVFSSGLTVVETSREKVQIDVPRGILNACDELQEKFKSSEFSIVCKGKWDEDGKYIITDEFEVPKQKVYGAAVDYDLEHLAELKALGFNAIIHSHPFYTKSTSFSASDDETINSHFECSILYSGREFTTATITIVPVVGMKLIIPGEPGIEGENIVSQAQIENIEKGFNESTSVGSFQDASFGGDVYSYDEETDTFMKNGVAIDRYARERKHRGYDPRFDSRAIVERNQRYRRGQTAKDFTIVHRDNFHVHDHRSCNDFDRNRHVAQIPRGCGCGMTVDPNRDRVFVVDSTRVFNTDTKQGSGGKKGKKNKNKEPVRDNSTQRFHVNECL
jgi:hypothetical protein